MTTKRYSHALDIGWNFESDQADPADAINAERHAIVAALLNRLSDLFLTDEWNEAIGCFDSYSNED